MSRPVTPYVTDNPSIQAFIARHGVDKWLIKRANLYHNMHKRIYSTKLHEQNHYLSYRDCEMCADWLYSPELFYQWLEDNYYEVAGYEDDMQLDKDILIPGNRVYCPDRCVFVPACLNNDYRLQPSRLDDPEYCKEQTERIHRYAQELKGQIPRRLYNALMRFDITISDEDTE